MRRIQRCLLLLSSAIPDYVARFLEPVPYYIVLVIIAQA